MMILQSSDSPGKEHQTINMSKQLWTTSEGAISASQYPYKLNSKSFSYCKQTMRVKSILTLRYVFSFRSKFYFSWKIQGSPIGWETATGFVIYKKNFMFEPTDNKLQQRISADMMFTMTNYITQASCLSHHSKMKGNQLLAPWVHCTPSTCAVPVMHQQSICTCFHLRTHGGPHTYPAQGWNQWSPETRTTHRCFPYLKRTGTNGEASSQTLQG